MSYTSTEYSVYYAVLNRSQSGSVASLPRMSLEESRAQLSYVVDPGDPRSYIEPQGKIADGSTSTVYLVADRQRGRQCALKRIDLRRQSRRELLINEVLVLRNYQHPNIVQMFAAHLVNNELWILMEYLDGGSLTEHINRSTYAPHYLLQTFLCASVYTTSTHVCSIFFSFHYLC